MKSFQLKHSWESIWKKNVQQITTNNCPSNNLENYFRFPRYCPKYHRCRRQFFKELTSFNGLNQYFLSPQWLNTCKEMNNLGEGAFKLSLICRSLPVVCLTTFNITRQYLENIYIGLFNQYEHLSVKYY